MKKAKILALVLALAMIVSAVSGCGGKDKTGGGASVGTVDVAQDYAEFPEELTAKKIGSIDFENFTSNGSGCCYKTEDDKYGIISADGKKDTGAIYEHVNGRSNGYFEVASKKPTEKSSDKELNCFGLVGPTGEEVIPQKYAYFDYINERYYMVCEITEKTENEDEALIYGTESLISMGADEDDVLYKGKWYVYDVTTGKMLDGVTGTKAQDVVAYGACIAYRTDKDEKIVINAKGEKIPEEAKMFENGYYIVEADTEGTLYDPEGKKAFSYNPKTDFAPCQSAGDHFLAMQQGDVTKYAFMDSTGKIISAEFSKTSSDYVANPQLYGNMVFYEGKVHDLEGNVIVDGTFEIVNTDEITEKLWSLKDKDDKYTVIKEDGAVLYEGVDEDPVFISAVDEFSFVKKVDDKEMYYSLKDKDYTIEGKCLYGWLIETTKDDESYDIVDAISGKTIIEGYADYQYAALNGHIYVYAKTEDGGYDIFEVK